MCTIIILTFIFKFKATTVAYPAPRPIAPPGPFSSQGNPVNLAASISANINTNLPGTGLVASGPTSGQTIGSSNSSLPPQKQRVFTGTITKLCSDFGFVDEDVFFQTR